MLVWSRFNILYKSPKYGFFLYNSKNNVFYKLTLKLYNQLKNIEQSVVPLSILEEDLFQQFIKKMLLLKKDTMTFIFPKHNI